MTNSIKVVAMVVDNGNLTFYKLDGSTHVITQGDPRGPVLSETFLAGQKLGHEVIDLDLSPDAVTQTHLNSPKRSKLLRFFTVPAAAVKKLFGRQSHESGFDEAAHEKAAARVREIASRLMKSGDDEKGTEDLPIRMVTTEEPMGDDETIIAVSEDGIVPHVENLSDQFKAGEEGKAPAQGPDNLLLRLAKISAKRGHTGAELLNFIKKIDLPINDDGSFYAYKRLISEGNGLYTDPHSRKVFQRVGDLVQMDESLVDKNRRQECSQGIHVGTRHYMGGFHGKETPGSGTCLVLIQPEDVIAVPEREASKMRCCRYLLVGDLSDTAHDLVNENKRIDDCKTTMELLAQLVAGARPPLLGVVNIGGAGGSKLTYTINGKEVDTKATRQHALNISKGVATAPTKPVTPVRTIDDSKQGHTKDMLAPAKVRDKAHAVTPASVKKAAATPPTRQEIAGDLAKTMRDAKASDIARGEAATKLRDYKKKAKVSWDALGLQGDIAKEIEEIILITTTKPKSAPQKPKAPTPAPKAAPAAKVQAKPEPKAEPAKAKAPEPVKAPASGGTRQDRARALWDIIQTSKDKAHQKKAAQELKDFKSKAKVSWSALGLGSFNVEAALTKHLG